MKGIFDVSERVRALGLLEAEMKRRREDILEALEADLGKPEVEGFLAEYWFVLQELKLMRRNLVKWTRPRRVGSPVWFWPARSRVELCAFGNVLVISPWNYPIQLALAPVVTAIAAGNSVVLKPSEMTPTCGRLLKEVLESCFPGEVVKVELGGKEVAERLLGEKFDFIFFTGSTEVGKVVADQAAKYLTPCVLELGGKCPCVVDATADLEIAAKRILIGKLFNGGQTCFAPDFVVVEEGVRGELVAELERLLFALPWEDEMSRIINEKHYDRVRGLISDPAIRKGQDDRGALRIAPTILPEAGWEDGVMQEEIFGPVLPVLGYGSVGELVNRLGSYGSPLALYIFSRDRKFVFELQRRIRSGGVCINDTMKQGSTLELPFGGVGESGNGRYRGKRGVEMFSYERAVMRRYFLPDVFEMLPPRGKMGEMMKRFF